MGDEFRPLRRGAGELELPRFERIIERNDASYRD
jgi:hypothetical protein